MVNPLARVIMEKNLKTEQITNPRIVSEGSNLDNREREIISGIINGEREVMEVTKKSTAITLDEAANKIKNNR